MFARSLLVAVLVLSTVAIVAPRALAQQPAPTPKPATLTVQFACPDVPWSCLNTKTATKWQMYETFCNQNDVCRFKHVQQVNSGDTFTLKSLAQWRLYMGPADDSTNKIMDCSPYLNQIEANTVLEVFGACTRNPALCAGPKHWQVYECLDKPDGSCSWVYAGEYNKDCLYFQMLATPGRHVKIHWGEPFELEPTATPTTTQAPTRTRTATTRVPTATWEPVASQTPFPTSTPGTSRTSTRTRTPTPVRTLTPTRPRPTATNAAVFRLGLPRLSRP